MHDLTVLSLENDWFSLSVLPEVGGKILALHDKSNARDILWKNSRIEPQRYPIDANFDNYWCGGWDDAYPTADACVHAGEPFPNLGELRSLHWQIEERSNERIRLSVFGPISAIRATKEIWLSGRVLQMRFSINSLSHLPIDYLWGTHPAFAIEAGTRLILPASTGLVAQANDASLGFPGETYQWPHLRGTDMSKVPDASSGLHCGHYAMLQDGWFAVETAGLGILYEFPVEKCPYLWMWLVYGGWRGYYHAVIEPWTGYPVNLAQAVEEGRHNQLPPGGAFSVTIRCTAYRTPETPQEALERIRS